MTLSAKIEPSLRRAVFTSPSFLASGDVSEDLVLEFPHRAPDAAGLSLTLRREGPSGDVVAVATGFEAVERHSHMVSCALSLKTSALDAWRLDDLAAGSSDDAKDRPSGPYRTAWLDVFDGSSVYVSCAVPVLLRDVYSVAGADGTVRYDLAQSLSSDEAARARSNISAASASEVAAASDAADAAKTAASDAQAAADAAKTAADGAASTATRALSQSTDAKADASDAKSTAADAKTAADAAKTAAGNAASAAATAVSSAESALSSASDAVDAAASAQSVAQSAQSTAQSAQAAAQSAQAAVDALKSTVPVLDDGVIPAKYLPSYVDDVLEAASKSAFPASGEPGKIYVALDTNLAYRWGGSSYVEISPSLALGETASTAYAGDKGAGLAADVASLKTSKADQTDLESLRSTVNSFDTHLSDTANPHNVSASQVGCYSRGESDALYFPLSRESELAKAADLSGYLPKSGGTLESGARTTSLTLGSEVYGYGQVELSCDHSSGGSIMLKDSDGIAQTSVTSNDVVVCAVSLRETAAAATAAGDSATEAKAAAAEATTALSSLRSNAVLKSSSNTVASGFSLAGSDGSASGATLEFGSSPSGTAVTPSRLYVTGAAFFGSGVTVIPSGSGESSPVLSSLNSYGADSTTALSEVNAIVAPVKSAADAAKTAADAAQAAVDALAAKVDAANQSLEEVA